MALIDYMGFRLIALSILPIGSATTLRYGTSDGGQTMHADDDRLNALMRDMATRLNLVEHLAGMEAESTLSTRIAGPADIEAHCGLDGRYYVVDFARVFPPEAPDISPLECLADRPQQKADETLPNVDNVDTGWIAQAAAYATQFNSVKGRQLYRLLRAEHVARHDKPLCSDAYSAFAAIDNDFDAYNDEVRRATLALFKERIPAFAAELDKKPPPVLADAAVDESPSATTQLWFRLRSGLVDDLHRAGINVRHLGAVRNKVTHSVWRQVILIEMVARVIKNRLRTLLRQCVVDSGAPSEEPAREAVVNLLNALFGKWGVADDADTAERWAHSTHGNVSVKCWLVRSFGPLALLKHERGNTTDLRTLIGPDRKNCGPIVLLLRVLDLSGIALLPETLDDFRRSLLSPSSPSTAAFQFVPSDVHSFAAEVTHTDLVTVSEAMALLFDAKEMVAKGTSVEESTRRVLSVALSKFRTLLPKMPHEVPYVRELGALFADKLAATPTDASAYSLAIDSLKLVLEVSPNDADAWGLLCHVHSLHGDSSQAEAAFNKATQLDPRNVTAHYYWAAEQNRHNRHSIAESLYCKVAEFSHQTNAAIHVEALVMRANCIIQQLINVEWRMHGYWTRDYLAQQHDTAIAELSVAGECYHKALAIDEQLAERHILLAKHDLHAYTAQQALLCTLWAAVLVKSPLVEEVIADSLPALNISQLELSVMVDDVIVKKMIDVVEPIASLTNLSLNGCAALTDESVAYAVSRLSTLSTLELGGCQVSAYTLQQLATSQQTTSLTSLSLKYVEGIPLEVLREVLSHLPNLESIDLTKIAEPIDDHTVQVIGTTCTNLRKLVLGEYPQLSDLALSSIVSTKLSSLTITGTNFTLGGIQTLVINKFSSTLTELLFGGLSSCTDRGVIDLFLPTSPCTNLHLLVLPSHMPIYFTTSEALKFLIFKGAGATAWNVIQEDQTGNHVSYFTLFHQLNFKLLSPLLPPSVKHPSFTLKPSTTGNSQQSVAIEILTESIGSFQRITIDSATFKFYSLTWQLSGGSAGSWQSRDRSFSCATLGPTVRLTVQPRKCLTAAVVASLCSQLSSM